MSDPRQKLAEQWNSAGRYHKFGNVLLKLTVRGVRCHDETVIDIRNPVTAFSGFNGTGKSTLLQLAAAGYACASPFTIDSFIRRGPLDQTVFSGIPSVGFEFQDERGTKPLTLSYNALRSRWQGYERRP